MVKLAGQFVPLRVNIEKEGADLARMYKVVALPTVLFIDAEGDVWGKAVGYRPPKAFMVSMQEIIDVRKAYVAAKQTLKRRPNDGKANAQIARVHATFGRLTLATSAINKMEAANYKGEGVSAAYNALGKGHQSAEQFDEAIKYFVKADGAGKAAKSLEDRSLALISIVDCYASIGDMETAKKYAIQLVTLNGGTKRYVDRARKFLGSG